jgi:ribose transport system substrate-binding protein
VISPVVKIVKSPNPFKGAEMYRLRKRASLLAAGAVMTLGLAACAAGTTEMTTTTEAEPSGDTAESCGPLRVGVAVYNMSSYITQGQEGMQAFAEVNDIELLWNSADDDVANQASQIDTLINQEVDAIIIVPAQADSLRPQLEAAKEADIPVLTVNTTLDFTDLITSSVLPDDVAAGSQQMQQMADALGGSGNIVVLQGPLGSSPEINRTQGIMNVLDEYPDINVLAIDTANWARDQAANLMANWITSFGDQIDGVVAENDDMALGAIQAMKEAGLDPLLPVVGIDGIEDGIRAVQAGEMIGSSLQHGRVQLAAGLAVAQKVACGEPVESNYDYIMPPIDASNVDSYLGNVVTDVDAFLQRLPELVAKNLETGNIANED